MKIYQFIYIDKRVFCLYEERKKDSRFRESIDLRALSTKQLKRFEKRQASFLFKLALIKPYIRN